MQRPMAACLVFQIYISKIVHGPTHQPDDGHYHNPITRPLNHSEVELEVVEGLAPHVCIEDNS